MVAAAFDERIAVVELLQVADRARGLPDVLDQRIPETLSSFLIVQRESPVLFRREGPQGGALPR